MYQDFFDRQITKYFNLFFSKVLIRGGITVILPKNN